MSAKRVLILDGHPAESSLSRYFCETYARIVRDAGHEVRIMHLHDMTFDPDFEYAAYRTIKPLEKDLTDFLTSLEWCEHFMMASPMWWGGLPAKLKGLIDRSFLPGRVFDTRGEGYPRPMLGGRRADVVLTSDSPWWYFRFLLHRPLLWQLRKQVLEYVGFKPVRVLHFSLASKAAPEKVEQWRRKVQAMAARVGA